MLRDTFASRHHGDSAAILGGDYACALAQDALLDLKLPADRLLAAARLFATMQGEVVLGQMLDVNPSASRASVAAVEAMHDLKTGSYTVRGPVMLGAILAGANSTQLDCLQRFASPLGIAFQLRDDLLGTFGDAAKIGKPVGSDIRKGKRTSLVAAIESDPASRSALDRAFGIDDASDDDVDAVRARMVQSGAKKRVEDRLASLTYEASLALDEAKILESGRTTLRAIAEILVHRDM
jgi:geranylgeranyl diphosphate synthase type I